MYKSMGQAIGVSGPHYIGQGRICPVMPYDCLSCALNV